MAVAAAFGGGRPWLEGVIDIISARNPRYVEETLAEKLPEAVVSPLEGTLQWVDLGAYVKPNETQELIQNKCRLAVDYGEWFGGGVGSFIRLNLATSPENIKEAVSRIVKNIG